MTWQKKGRSTNGVCGKAYLHERRILVRVECWNRSPQQALINALDTLAHEIAHLQQFAEQKSQDRDARARLGKTLRELRGKRIRWGGTERRTEVLASQVVRAFQENRDELLRAWFQPPRHAVKAAP